MPAPDPLQATLSFPLTVDADLGRTAQTLLRRECGGAIRAIRLELIPDRHQARLWVTLATAAYGVALHAIILGLPAAEFGAVRTLGVDSGTASVEKLAA